MLLGEFEQRLDDKNRVTLPARLRVQFEDGLVCAKGLDDCVTVWPRAAWDDYVSAQTERLDSFTREGRALERFIFSGALECELDRQGRVALPCAARRPCVARPGDRDRRGAEPAGDLEPRELAPPASSSRRERRGCCRAHCQHQVLSCTFPSFRTRYASSWPCGQATPSSTAPSEAAGTPPLLAQDLHGRGQFIAIDRDPDAGAAHRGVRALAAGRRRAVGPAQLVRPGTRGARRARVPRRRDPVRPRRLVDAARSSRARLLVRQRRAARHADGSARGAERGRPRERVERGRSRAHLHPLRRGAVRAADRPRDRAPPRRAAVPADARSGRHRARRHPDARPLRRRDTRPSASSRPSGSRSTTS